MISSNTASISQTLMNLEDFVGNLLLLLSDKERFVVNKRFNLDNKGKMTLQQIGNEFSVTRERVRQIEKTALSKMKRNVFNTPFRHLHEYVASLVSQEGGVCREDFVIDQLAGLLPGAREVNCDNLHLSLVLHEDLECVGNTINFYPYIRENRITDFAMKHLAGKLVNQLHKYGDVKSVAKLHNDLQSTVEDSDFDIKSFESLISIDKRLTLVKDDLVGLLEWRHIHPRTLRDKILFILRSEKKPLHFTDIAEKIRSAKFDRRPLNLQAVHNELIRHDSFVLIGRGIYALSEWGYERGTVSDVIARILEENDELDLERIVELVLEKRQVKRITIMLALKNGDKFERVGRKRYKLV